jgi:hypothetical protein
VRVNRLWLWLMMICLSAGLANAYVFDALDVSSKARGMGGAWTAGADDATAVCYNPACLAGLADANVTASYLKPNSQDFESLTFLALGTPLRFSQGVAIGYRKFGVEYGGQSLLDESTLSFAHGLTLMQDIHSSLALGYCINVYRLEFGRTENVDLGSETTFGVDLGFLGTLRERTRIGFLLKNVNEPSIGKHVEEPLPQWISAGVSYSPYYGVITELDLRGLRGEDVEVHMGMQFAVTQFLNMRFGFQTGPNSLTGGFTAKLKPVEIDYSYSSHSVLPGTHHVSVRGWYVGKQTR